MEFLTREDLLGADAPTLQEEIVPISWRHPKTGKLIERQVIVREPTVEQKTAFEQSLLVDGKVDEAKVREALIVSSTYGPNGPVFTPDDVAAISKLGGGTLEPVVNAAMRVGKTSAQDISDIAKKSGATRG